ncbi:MAG: type II secretion system major pseudopilin GspG [Candidatus Omnitrophica bacterium]|nr:type II secretion system major pseudopilin GspG [Candidatus Omnitrophota bacterium]
MKKYGGFTLIELMLVVMIIATLAALVVPKFTGRAEQAKVAAARADIMVNIPTALDLYELDNGFYPTTEQGLEALLAPPVSAPVPPKWRGPYIKKKPVDPWGNPYHYEFPGRHNRNGYDLYSFGKDGVEGGKDDITNWEEN